MTQTLDRTESAFIPEWKVEPKCLGPTWQRNPNWNGLDPLTEFVLPEFTLGWQIIRWINDNLNSDEVDEHGQPTPFQPTREQTRFILWWYAVDEHGRFIYRDGVLQRLKGWLPGAKTRSSR